MRRWSARAEGLTCTTAVHICYGYGIKANIDWKETLGSEWRQYEDIFPTLAQEPDPAGRDRMPQLAGAARTACFLKGKKVQAGVIDVASDAVETADDVVAVIDAVLDIRAQERHHPVHQLRHGADAPRHRRSQADALGAGAKLARERFG